MNAADWLILAVIAVCFVWVLRSLWKGRGKGCPGCGGSCAGCSACSAHRQSEDSAAEQGDNGHSDE